MEKKKLILLIDDEVDLVDLIKFQLMAKGYDVRTAGNGLEGLEQLKTLKPDLIILDVNMPKMGGLEFCTKITTAHGRTKYPVLILTARANLEKVFQDIHIEGFMPKPFEVDKLMAEVERIVSQVINPTVYLIDFKESSHTKKICEFFQGERYDVINVEDFKSLEDKSKERKPDFIILEYMQKGISGEEFIRKIKENPLFNGVPVLVYSFSGFAQYGEKSLKAGADKYLGKPSENLDVFIVAMKELQLRKAI